ncbi:hypothetical protein SOP91_00215 (plasmid) [Enterobacter hormaechei]|uniref:DUF7609 family protein n=1 Tax=Enterobacter hormaechei TaxID=158836 RepID=UPI002B4C20D8|nr:hypothetical protein [Enterobacter hormaechei]WRM07134.1 hypothetical protein SOP91_00215 [Enterobacter hormaechei]
MPKKLTVDTTAVSKPARTGLRSQLAALPVGQSVTISEVSVPENGEAAISAAMRTSQKLRSNHSRSVTDVRKKTGQKYTINSSRTWENNAYTCHLQIIRIA